jgi:hypothetical protein
MIASCIFVQGSASNDICQFESGMFAPVYELPLFSSHADHRHVVVHHALGPYNFSSIVYVLIRFWFSALTDTTARFLSDKEPYSG